MFIPCPTTFIVCACILFYILDEKKLVNASDLLYFSSGSLKKGYVWILITSTFCHDGFSHFLNNMLMFLLYSFSFEREFDNLLTVFLLCGTIGLCFNFVWNRFKYGSELADYILTCGASPATYGCLFYLATLRPDLNIADSLSFIPPLAMVLVVFLVPAAVNTSNKYPYSPLFFPRSRSLITVPLLVCVCYFLDNVLPVLTACTWLHLYLLNTVVIRLYHILVGKASLEYASTDNASHLGGGCCGVMLALSKSFIPLQSQSSSRFYSLLCVSLPISSILTN